MQGILGAVKELSEEVGLMLISAMRLTVSARLQPLFSS